MLFNNFNRGRKLMSVASGALLLVLFACGQKSGDQKNLEISLQGTTTFAIGGSQASCSAISTSTLSSPITADLQPLSFQLLHPKIKWSDDSKPIVVYSVVINFQSNNLDGGSYTCTIAGDEFGYLFASGTGLRSSTTGLYDLVKWDGALPSPTSTVPNERPSSPVCPAIRCGGLRAASGVTHFAVSGTMTVNAYTIEADGSQRQVTVQTPLSVQN